MASTFLRGVALSNFRGIGAQLQRIGPFRDINFFIGANNSGKSTVLNFLSRYLGDEGAARRAERWSRKFDPIDYNINGGGASPSFAVAIDVATLRDALVSRELIPRYKKLIDEILRKVARDDLLYLFPMGSSVRLEFDDVSAFQGILPESEWYGLWSQLVNKTGGGFTQHWIPETLSALANICEPSFPGVRLIPAIREVGASGSEFNDYSGKGLIDKLAELQNPPHNERDKRKKFEAINTFLSAVTDSEGAMIEVPHDRRHLLVHMDGKILPLASLGTGIHEVVMLASFCTIVEKQIVCIEEPEIHLHPLLQRKFIRYLRDNTSNQYFIATHSPSMIDAVEASVFHVELRGGESTICLAKTSNDRFEICRQLGYVASDLLQSNAIVWVEGPSDRIYLKHWISASAPELVEGLDYSIMFYGGRLLSHLSADDPEVTDFISLRRLNRNIVIVIDSDKKSAHAKLNATKLRVQGEFGDGLTWITAGREIENYVPLDAVSEALSSIYGESFVRILDSGRYAERLKFQAKGRSSSEVEGDKVKVAKFIASRPADLTQLDLHACVGRLVSFIRKANEHK